MPPKLRLSYFVHSLSSDWNNGNAHFLRGLMRALVKLSHDVKVYEPELEWSISNLAMEANGQRSLQIFRKIYPELDLLAYANDDSDELWTERLCGTDIVILHEWNPQELAAMLLRLRRHCGYKLLFHDTHHRASSSPAQIELFGLTQFDGILAFGGALRKIYLEYFGIVRVWVLHEAADVTVFKPDPEIERTDTLVWIGNWGDGERSAEICTFLLQPAAVLRSVAVTKIYGVRYPEQALETLKRSGVTYGGYLANLDAPEVYAQARATMHVPRQQYNRVMKGIPTIRVFEALACGIPLVSAPWQDTEQLFRAGDFRWAHSALESESALRLLLTDHRAAEDQAARGLETVLSRHTCDHRAQEFTAICEEVLL